MAQTAQTLPGANLPGKTTVTLKVNGSQKTLSVRPWTSLLDALRDHLDLTGTKKGCDHGQCGACTVLVNDDEHADEQFRIDRWPAGVTVVARQRLAQIRERSRREDIDAAE